MTSHQLQKLFHAAEKNGISDLAAWIEQERMRLSEQRRSLRVGVRPQAQQKPTHSGPFPCIGHIEQLGALATATN